MFCSACGAKYQDSDRFCPNCGHQFGAAPSLANTSVVKPKPVTQGGFDVNHLTGKQISLIVLGIVAFLIVCGLLTDTSKPTSDQEKSQAISAIQQRYRPSSRLMTLNPDTHDAYWLAFKNPAECDYPEHKNCWKVTYYVSVMPEAETKEIQCEWLIDMDTMQNQPSNTEARTMFLPN